MEVGEQTGRGGPMGRWQGAEGMLQGGNRKMVWVVGRAYVGGRKVGFAGKRWVLKLARVVCDISGGEEEDSRMAWRWVRGCVREDIGTEGGE